MQYQPIQTRLSPDGSGSIHSIRGDFKGKISAYYSEGGVLVDAEQILPNRQNRQVKPNGPIWREISRRNMGWIYRPSA